MLEIFGSYTSPRQLKLKESALKIDKIQEGVGCVPMC